MDSARSFLNPKKSATPSQTINPNDMDSINEKQLANLNAAELALRLNLHDNFIDEKARSHMERAMNHLREASLATTGDTRARTVDDLVSDLKKFERLIAAATQKVSVPKSVSIKV